MKTILLAAFTLSRWFWESWAELTTYFDDFSVTQWAVISASTVAFGFLCLRGNTLKP